jgi:hypothetical protein
MAQPCARDRWGEQSKRQINNLSDDFVTPAMKKWARLDANEAAHDPQEFSKEDADKLHVFARMFLTYAFTLPAMLEKAPAPSQQRESKAE